ncbi:Retrovirus-related Pol polyprotein from transposon TNT 1-94 [Grifola frondosa]|uniref:Retrovirus-related Pol polyprotein from transposon TNT 1-94 n=1 Tax=Grifola frondosa TaxID=5627 RepID=A0A1C7LZS0_GRIFR|nr:Retrovirus-related Pol polyprotein from transposon TNT 1-94 [Grifola frondosa]
MTSPFAAQWCTALEEEFASIRSMDVYKLIPPSHVPSNHKIMHGKPVFRLKHDEHGAPICFKAQWVCKGYEAVFGQDYTKTTLPTMRMESLCTLVHIAAAKDWELDQIDVKTAYLYGLLPDNEVCYMYQSEGFEEAGKEDWVWELHHGLYGMPQGGRTWNVTMDTHLTSIGFTRLQCEYCIYYHVTDTGIIITGMHIDDFIIVSSSRPAVDEFKHQLRDAWSISDLGKARFCVGIAIDRDRATHTARLSQVALIDKILAQFHLADAHSVSTPLDPSLRLSHIDHSPKTDKAKAAAAKLPYRALVGSLNYVAVGSRPDISFAVQHLSQFMDCYGQTHWDAAKRVARYLKGTRDLRLHLSGPCTAHLIGFTDSNHGASRKQATVSISSTESEYIATTDAAHEGVFLRALLLALGLGQQSATPLLGNNTSAHSLSGDPSFHSCTKHIAIRHHHICKLVATEQISISYVPSKDNVANAFTKPLPQQPFLRLRNFMGLF